MDIASTHVGLLSLISLGVIIGLISGLFGVGGGFLLTPLLSVVFQIPIEIAVGSGLCQMVGASTVAFLKHRQLGRGEPRFAVLLIPGSLLGVTAAAFVVRHLENLGTVSIGQRQQPVIMLVLYGVFVVFLLGIAVIMWRQGSGRYEQLDYVRRGPLSLLRLGPAINLPAVPLTEVSAILIAYVGLTLGFFSGLLGIGGGVVLIPVLLYGFGFPFHQIPGTGIVVTLLTAVVGTVAHAHHGHVDLRLAMVLLIGSGISAQVGAIGSQRFAGRTLRKGLALVVLLTIAVIVVDLLRKLL